MKTTIHGSHGHTFWDTDPVPQGHNNDILVDVLCCGAYETHDTVCCLESELSSHFRGGVELTHWTVDQHPQGICLLGSDPPPVRPICHPSHKPPC